MAIILCDRRKQAKKCPVTFKCPFPFLSPTPWHVWLTNEGKIGVTRRYMNRCYSYHPVLYWEEWDFSISNQGVGVLSKMVFHLTLAMIVTLMDPFSVESIWKAARQQWWEGALILVSKIWAQIPVLALWSRAGLPSGSRCPSLYNGIHNSSFVLCKQ